MSGERRAWLTLATVLAAYAWLLSWFNWSLWAFYTTHVADNVRILGTFYRLLGSLRLGAALPELAWAAAIFASALSLGRLILDFSRLETREDWGRNWRALAVGFGSLSLLLLALGLAGLWTKPVMTALVLAPLVVGAVRHGRGLAALARAARPPTLTLWEALGFALLASYAALNLMFALGPEHFYDSLVYHLAMPRLYLLHERIIPTPHMLYSGIPFGTEMLYGLGLALGTETLAKLLHFGLGAATAGAIYGWCRTHVDRRTALLAALLFYSAPLVCFLSSVAKVELAMTFYYLLAALLIVRDEAADARTLILAGALAGFSFGTKYNAGLYIPVLALPLAYARLRAERFEAMALLRDLGLYFGAATLVSCPWLLKNQVFYGNPVYPFLDGLFGGGPGAAGLSVDAHARDLDAAFTTWAGFKSLLGGLWDPVAQSLDSYLGPALLVGFPWLFLARLRPAHRGLAIILAGVWAAWALHTSLARFILPSVPLFCILVSSAVWLVEMPRRLRFVVVGVFCYTITISLGRTFLMLARPDTWKVAVGRATKSEYLLHEHPSYDAPYFAGVRFVNEVLPPDATVLFIAEERGYYCERKFITASVYDKHPFLGWAESSMSANDLLTKVKKSGVTHLLINAGSARYGRWLQSLGASNAAKYHDMLSRDAQKLFELKWDVPRDRVWVLVYKLD